MGLQTSILTEGRKRDKLRMIFGIIQSMKNRVILAIGAHPDDTDFGASGTIAKWVEEGATAYYLICTDGSRGSKDPKMTHQKLALIRRKEQEEAAEVLGIKKVFFLDHADTQLVVDNVLKEQIVRIIRKVRPNTVITMDPTFYYSQKFGFINHTDHRAAGLATLDACFPLSRDRLTFPQHEKEGLKPHKVEELLLVNLEKADFLVDITTTIDKKIKALACHKSQFDDFKKIEKMIRTRSKMQGKKVGYKFAESFLRLNLP
ncbi:MAG: PIG-L deacetylase family protein [Candidatus Levybacteria bacterium]|nr:PIG-L deacetylase family protein [Candidatus Levybacteria bacterium]